MFKINEVKNKTGVTKKAIRYYESKGLIKPYICENGYRLFCEEDIELLNIISFLRNINMNVINIKRYVETDEENKKKILLEHSFKITKEIDQLTLINEIIKDVTNNDKTDYKMLTDELIKHESNNPEFTLHRLANLFPTNFGRYLIIHFGPYLSVPLDTKEKIEAFKRIVDFVDNTQMNFSENVENYWATIDEEMRNDKSIDGCSNRDSIYKAMSNGLNELAEIDDMDNDRIDSLRKEISDYIEIKNNSDNKREFEDIDAIKEEMRIKLKDSGFYENFNENLKIINPRYGDYCKKLELLNEKLGLTYGENGSIKFEES